MTLGVTNRVALRIKPEATWGTTPTTGNYYGLRITGETLKYAIQTVQSNEFRSDRMITDLVQVAGEATGDINFEFSYGEFDSLLASALQGPWSAIGTGGATTGTATYVSSTGLTITGASLTNLVAGQWFRIVDATTTANTGWHKAVTVPTATTLTVASGFTAATGNAGVVVQAARIVNSTSQTSFAIERNNADLTQFGMFNGMTPSRLSLNLTPGQILTGSISFMGKSASAQAGTSAMPGTAVTSLTNSIYNSVSNVFNILEAGAALTNTYAKSLTINVDNSLRGQTAIGNLANVGIAAGNSVITGTLELYFADATYLNKFINGTASTLELRIGASSTGIGYRIAFPNIKYTDGAAATPGANQDVTLALPFQALRDSTSGYQMIVDRGGDAVTLWSTGT